MTAPPTSSRWPSLLLALLVGGALGAAGALGVIWARHRPNPQERVLDANLYVQTSAEYRACCLQAYNVATRRVKAHAAGAGKPPAVVLDLDETVLDNSPFQTFLYRHGLDYSDPLWDEWERNHPDDVLLVPGAKDFIEASEKLGVTVFYVSNRLEQNRDFTVAALKHLGLNVEDVDRRLLLKKDTGDKTPRRKQVEASYRVLLYAGDNLRDFSEEFKAPTVEKNDTPAQALGIAARKQQVDRQRERWGKDWIILPNPIYGEWQRLLRGRPTESLRQTTMKPPAAPAK